jgi:hypothetical protein
MTIYYLMVKTHNITGLKYLCQTKRKNPYKYLGSGVDWCNHLKKYGNNIETTVLISTTNKEERNYWGRYYSELWRITTAVDNYGNKIWANRIPETGGGGGNNLSTEDRVRMGKISVSKQIKENKHNWSKKGFENCNYDHTIYKFENIFSGEIIESTQYDFRNRFGYLQGNVGAMVRGLKKTCVGWKMYGSKTPNQYIKHQFINTSTNAVVSMTQDEFVKTYNLNRGHVCQMIKRNKKFQSVKGWKLYSS